MLMEVKCLVCKYYLHERRITWEHKCKAYPYGIPERIFKDNSNHKLCDSSEFSFEYRTGKPEMLEDYIESFKRSYMKKRNRKLKELMLEEKKKLK